MHLHRRLRHFREKSYPKHRDLFEKLATGQSPKTLFITCSDSRIVPDLLMQADPGELFVIRNAGNLVPAYGSGAEGAGASIEYAVAALKVSHIVVCGHSDCGAMKGVLDPAGVAELPEVAEWLKHADASRARAVAQDPAGSDKPSLGKLIEANVLSQIDNLRTHPSVAAAVARGELKIHGWVYHIGSGRIDAHDTEVDEFRAANMPDSEFAGEVA